jgi:ribulose-phosphate 3-epimerase
VTFPERTTSFFRGRRLAHECGVPGGFGTPHLCGSEEFCRAPTFPLSAGLKLTPAACRAKSGRCLKHMSNRKIQIAASIICADWGRLEEHLRVLEELGIDRVHCDVMDGRFVPNITFGPGIQSQMHLMTNLPLETHLMIEEPDRYVEAFMKAGSRLISVHAEGQRHLDRTLRLIASAGAIPGVAINPATPLANIEHVLEIVGLVLVMTVNPGFAGQELVPYTLEKVRKLRAMVAARGLNIDLEVDGNVSFQHIPQMLRAGANVLVAGTSSLYGQGGSLADRHAKLLELIEREAELP